MIAAPLTATVLSDLAPVSLEALVAEAELLSRFDRKYLVPVDDAKAILSEVDPHSRVLEIDGKRNFSYSSVYFDTPDHLAYRLTAQRRRHRFKIRTRSYVDSGTCFFEVKTKSGRGQTLKQRINYSPEDSATITADGSLFATSILGEHDHGEEVIKTLYPCLTSEYQRLTLLLPDSSRATVDSNLTWHDDAGNTTALHDYVIIETKSSGRASDLDRQLWRTGHRPSGISKFGTGTAALRPDLPHNKWARTLAGPFQINSLHNH